MEILIHLVLIQYLIPEPEDITQYFNNLPVEKDYFPYPNKLVSSVLILYHLSQN